MHTRFCIWHLGRFWDLLPNTSPPACCLDHRSRSPFLPSQHTCHPSAFLYPSSFHHLLLSCTHQTFPSPNLPFSFSLLLLLPAATLPIVLFSLPAHCWVLLFTPPPFCCSATPPLSSFLLSFYFTALFIPAFLLLCHLTNFSCCCTAPLPIPTFLHLSFL